MLKQFCIVDIIYWIEIIPFQFINYFMIFRSIDENLKKLN
jgi:hypothetical protein